MNSDLPQMAKDAMAKVGWEKSQGWLAYDAFRAHLLSCPEYMEQNAPRVGVLLPDFMRLPSEVKAGWEAVARTMTADLKRQLVQCREAFNTCYAQVHELQAELHDLKDTNDSVGTDAG